MQLRFSRWLVLLVFLLVAADTRYEGPDRVPLAERRVAVRWTPLPLGGSAGPFRLAGAWSVKADDPRFFGLSALAARPERPLLALSDSGVLIDLPRPSDDRVAVLRDLPAGPGYPTFKKYRDSEALVMGEGGMWVTFEYRHSLWFFPASGAPVRRRLPSKRWNNNAGIEAMVADPDVGLLMLPEQEDVVLVLRGERITAMPLTGRSGGVADAARLPDGRIVVALRAVGLGLVNRLAWLEEDGAGFRLRPFARLPLGPADNVEGLAVEPLPGGGATLWAVTDNDGWRRTLLLKLDLGPAAAASSRSGRLSVAH